MGGRNTGREILMSERNICWLPLTHPQLGTWPCLQPRYVPWLGIKLATFRLQAGAQSTKPHQPEYNDFFFNNESIQNTGLLKVDKDSFCYKRIVFLVWRNSLKKWVVQKNLFPLYVFNLERTLLSMFLHYTHLNICLILYSLYYSLDQKLNFMVKSFDIVIGFFSWSLYRTISLYFY